ncbi:MAG: glycine zipper 2TM domain-containing protein [Sphingomonadaceae bacterium]|nr:glycine zipper 2TM domain-containing protein [Sphingomonadaceae bacterium]
MARKLFAIGALGTALAAASLATAPAEAHWGGYYGGAPAQHREGGYGDRGYYGGRAGYYGAGYGYDGGDRGGYGRYRCDRGTGGTIIGAIAGGLLGNAVAGYRDRTTGTVLGAGAGALIGRSIDRDC